MSPLIPLLHKHNLLLLALRVRMILMFSGGLLPNKVRSYLINHLKVLTFNLFPLKYGNVIAMEFVSLFVSEQSETESSYDIAYVLVSKKSLLSLFTTCKICGKKLDVNTRNKGE